MKNLIIISIIGAIVLGSQSLQAKGPMNISDLACKIQAHRESVFLRLDGKFGNKKAELDRSTLAFYIKVMKGRGFDFDKLGKLLKSPTPEKFIGLEIWYIYAVFGRPDFQSQDAIQGQTTLNQIAYTGKYYGPTKNKMWIFYHNDSGRIIAAKQR
jgi:hypothetical protein